MTASQKAWGLRSKLFALVGEFTDLVLSIHVNGDTDTAVDARSQADAVKCQLAAVYAEIGGPETRYDLFIDAARDAPEYGFSIDKADHSSADFPARLAALRTAAGLSIPDLARASGLSDDVLRQYEKGTRAPTWESVQKIAVALGVPTDAFREAK